jgi:hypothetical protein
VTNGDASTQEDAWGQVWRVDVAKSFSHETGGDEVVMEFEGVSEVPEEAAVCLVDRRLGSMTDLRTTSTYRFYQGRKGWAADNDARFALIVGNDEFIVNDGSVPALPTRTRLRQNYPNPFNPSTIIRYEIATASDVSLLVFDASGARVRELYRGPRRRGVYEVAWDAKNDAGRTVASGIYFCRLEAGDTIETRKMLLLK